MNYVSHLEVAHEIDPEVGPAFEVGAMLPDLAGLAGTRLHEGLGDALEWGVMLHKKTDAVFHDNPDFRQLQAIARPELKEALPKWTAYKVAHVGTELLLDGLLLEDDARREHYLSIMRWVGGHLDQLADTAVNRGDFRILLEDLALHGVPVHYRSPRGVAGALRRHRRIDLEDEQVQPLAGVLAKQQERLQGTAQHLWQSVLHGIISNN